MTDSFPRRRALTRGFRLGLPRDFTVPRLGTDVLFLRSRAGTDPVNDLWTARVTRAGKPSERKIIDARKLSEGHTGDLPPAERAKRERLREVSEGITAFTSDDAGSRVCFTLAGRIYVCDVATRRTRRIGTDSEVSECVIDPTGSAVAYVSGRGVKIADLNGPDHPRALLDPPGSEDSWGSAEFIAAEEMGRFRGMWWSPDGQRLLVTRVDNSAVNIWWIADPARPEESPAPTRYPVAGSPNADVSLWLVDRAGARIQIDLADWEYLARVHWSVHGDPIIQVQSRDQRRGRILSIDPRTGTTFRVQELSGPAVVELVPGVPRLTAGGLVHVVDDPATDTRRVTLDGAPISETRLQVRAVTGDDAAGVIVVASRDPETAEVFHLDWYGGIRLLSQTGGWATGTGTGTTTVIQRSDPEDPEIRTTWFTAGRSAEIESFAERPSVLPKPVFQSAGSSGIRVAVLMPGSRPRYPLPILLSAYGGPHAQRAVRSNLALATDQWLADQGFCVVVADGPGTPGRGPAWERMVSGDLAEGPLSGQIAALAHVVATLGDRVDPSRVGIRGWSFGGFLAALAVLERPDLFHAAVAGAPVTDWTLYDTHYTERYLGTPRQCPEAYRRSSLLERASGLCRPLLLVHGMSDDNVVVAHTLRLSSRLLAHGRPHCVLPLAGVTHMTPQEVVAENLLRREVDFLREALASPVALSPAHRRASNGK